MKKLPPDAVAVTAMDDYRLRVTFENGVVKEFDARALLGRKCYEKLRDKAFFKLAFTREGCVCWPGGIDIDPEWLFDDSIPV